MLIILILIRHAKKIPWGFPGSIGYGLHSRLQPSKFF
jgi:hypothetical protein